MQENTVAMAPLDMKYIRKSDRSVGTAVFQQPDIHFVLSDEANDLGQGIPGSRNRVQDITFLTGPYGQYMEYMNKDNVGTLEPFFDAEDDSELRQDNMLNDHEKMLDELRAISKDVNKVNPSQGYPDDDENPMVFLQRNVERARRMQEASTTALHDVMDWRWRYLLRHGAERCLPRAIR